MSGSRSPDGGRHLIASAWLVAPESTWAGDHSRRSHRKGCGDAATAPCWQPSCCARRTSALIIVPSPVLGIGKAVEVLADGIDVVLFPNEALDEVTASAVRGVGLNGCLGLRSRMRAPGSRKSAPYGGDSRKVRRLRARDSHGGRPPDSYRR